ncbi:MAG: VOC family protein [Pseudomonadota bacterium]
MPKPQSSDVATHFPFHLAFNVDDLASARHFYGQVLGCREGRSTETRVDFDFFGNQISLHLGTPFQARATGQVGQHEVLMPHLGVALPLSIWRKLGDRLKGHGVEFVIEPCLRFEGTAGEQGTMFFTDPSGNPIEIKGFNDLDELFAS